MLAAIFIAAIVALAMLGVGFVALMRHLSRKFVKFYDLGDE